MVVEDEPTARRYLVELIEDTGHAQVLAAVETFDEADEALRSENGLAFDVAFIDVHLTSADAPDEAGLALIRKHAASAPGARPFFVLATAYSQHVLEAYHLGVVDYLLKPFSDARVRECIERLERRFEAPSQRNPSQHDRSQQGPAQRIVARSKSGLVFFDIADVSAFEAEQRLVYVHANGQRFDLDLTLSMLERAFGDAFLRVQRNWLVNRCHISGMDRDDGETTLIVRDLRVPVSRDRAAEVRKALLIDALGIKSSKTSV